MDHGWTLKAKIFFYMDCRKMLIWSCSHQDLWNRKMSYVFQAMRNHLFTLGAKIKLISRKQVPNEISKSSGLIWNVSKMI